MTAFRPLSTKIVSKTLAIHYVQEITIFTALSGAIPNKTPTEKRTS